MNQTTTQEVKCFQDRTAVLNRKNGTHWTCELAHWLRTGQFEKALAKCKKVEAEVEFPNNHKPVVVALCIDEPEEFATREEAQVELEAFSDY